MNKQLYYGIVEDRQDPLKLGRCRVRIIGIHNINKNEVPTEALPWAQLITTGNSITVPKENEWVIIYFVDENTDYPVIAGTIPGLILSENEYPVGTPKWPNGTVAQKVDEPTTPRISRGDISDTPTKVSNDDKEHVCNISFELRAEILAARLRVSSAVQWLREQIQKLFSATSNSAFAQQLQAEIKRLTLELKKIQKVIKEINDIILEIAKIVQLIKDLIVWILSLPARLLAFLQQCLSQFFSSITEAFGASFGSITDASGITVPVSDVINLVQTANQTVTQASEVVKNTTQVATGVVDVVNSFERV